MLYTVLREPNFRPEPWFCPCRLTTSTPAGRVGHEPRAALLSGACPPRHAATARPHRPHPSVHMAPAQPASAHRPQPCAHGAGRVTWSGAGMREPHHLSPSCDASQIGGPVPPPSLTLTPPSAGLSDFDGKGASQPRSRWRSSFTTGSSAPASCTSHSRLLASQQGR